jgi:hypothetical protein
MKAIGKGNALARPPFGGIRIVVIVELDPSEPPPKAAPPDGPTYAYRFKTGKHCLHLTEAEARKAGNHSEDNLDVCEDIEAVQMTPHVAEQLAAIPEEDIAAEFKARGEEDILAQDNNLFHLVANAAEDICDEHGWHEEKTP